MKGELEMDAEVKDLYSYLDSLQKRNIDFYISAYIYFDEPLELDLFAYLAKWFRTKRYKYDIRRVEEIYGKIDQESCYFGEYGMDGEYIALNTIVPIGFCQNLDYVALPGDVPSKRSAFVFRKENELVYNPSSNDYHCFEWLNYLIKHFFEPNGYFLNGVVQYTDPKGHVFCVINVCNNIVSCNELVPGKV